MFQQGRPEEALELAELAWSRRQREDTPAESRASTAFNLAQFLWETDGDDAQRRARNLAERARQDYVDAGQAHAEELERVEQWLKSHPGESLQPSEELARPASD